MEELKNSIEKQLYKTMHDKSSPRFCESSSISSNILDDKSMQQEEVLSQNFENIEEEGNEEDLVLEQECELKDLVLDQK